MGTQGEMYVVYGVTVPAEVLWEKGHDQNPVIYKVGNKAYCDDDEVVDGDEFILDKLAYEGMKHAGVGVKGYGELDLDEQELCVRVLGHSGKHGGDMGSRHFESKALVGYPVCNAAYWNSAEPCPPMDKIKAIGPRLIADIKETLGLEIQESELRLHLLFDWLQGY